VTEALLEGLGMGAAAQQQRGVRVAQIVEADVELETIALLDPGGRWRVCETEYRVCRRCGYEEFVDFIGRIETKGTAPVCIRERRP